MVELAAASLRKTGSLRLRVTGSSMLPAVRPGDVIAIRACEPHAVGPGDVVVFERDGRLFAHRVVACEGDALHTRGDALDTCDAPVQARELLGRVVAIERRGCLVDPAKRHPMQRLAAQVFRRSPLAGRLFTRLNARGRAA